MYVKMYRSCSKSRRMLIKCEACAKLLVTVPIAVTKYSECSNLKEKVLILAHSSRSQCIC